MGFIVLLVGFVWYMYVKVCKKKSEFEPAIDQARENFMSNDPTLDPSIKTFKPINGTYVVTYKDNRGEVYFLREVTTTLRFTDLNDGKGYSISGSTESIVDGKGKIEEGFVRYDGSDAYWIDQIYEGPRKDNSELKFLTTGTFDFKSLGFTGTYRSSSGLPWGKVKKFNLRDGQEDAIASRLNGIFSSNKSKN